LVNIAVDLTLISVSNTLHTLLSPREWKFITHEVSVLQEFK